LVAGDGAPQIGTTRAVVYVVLPIEGNELMVGSFSPDNC